MHEQNSASFKAVVTVNIRPGDVEQYVRASTELSAEWRADSPLLYRHVWSGDAVVSESVGQITNSISVVNKILLIFYHEK